LTTEPVEWSTGQEPFHAAITLWAVGLARPNSAFLPDEVLDEDGYVLVDESLRVPGYTNVLAVGDVAASDAHRSSARNWGWYVVARNARAVARGDEPLRRFRPAPRRWGSVLGLLDDGMIVFQPNGRAVRVPRRLVQPLLLTGFQHTLLYGGIRSRRAGGTRPPADPCG
jgi:NADH dehydrogenase FAD-containing subunit